MNRSVLLLVVGAVLIGWSATEVLAAAQPKCSTEGYKKSGSTSAGLYCRGDCGAGVACPNPPGGSVTGHPAHGDYSYCACPGEVESPCCHLIWKKRGQYSYQKCKAIGDCADTTAGCPAGNKCTRTGSGTSSNPWKAKCIKAKTIFDVFEAVEVSVVSASSAD